MRDKEKYKRLREEIGKCELCGSKRNLEIHHIIPLSLIKDNPYADSEENLICICGKCHALLTPKKLLTSIGVRKAMNKDTVAFYKKLNDMTSSGINLSANDVLDVFDEIFC